MARDGTRVGAWRLLICWALIATVFTLRALFGLGGTPLILDTDDAMRLTVVHDLLAGQGWYDNIQHRLNVPHGAELHWSRLIDLPLAALLLLLGPLFGPAADTIAAYLWPLALLLPLLWLTARLALRLGGRAAVVPALLLPGFSLISMAEFAPGRLDHHSMQILLTLALLACTIEALRRPRFAAGAGLAAAAALAIGLEGLPMVLAAILAFGLAWISDDRHGAAIRDFGLSFGVATPLVLALGVAPARWLVPMTDAISIVYAIAALLCGLAFLALSLLPRRSLRFRLVVGVLAGIVVVGLLVALYPDILRGPYGLLDPWLLANWIDRISEAEPFFTSLAGEPVFAVAVLVPCALALGVATYNIVLPSGRRAAWLVYLLFLVLALAVMMLQIRAARIAVPLAVPGCAVLVGAAWQRMVGSRGFIPIFATLGAALGSASVAVAVFATATLLLFPEYDAATTDSLRPERDACLQPAAFAGLAPLSPRRIMAPIDLGSHLLLWTPHAVVAAPYHRNQQGVRDAFRFFNEPIDSARAILEVRGIDLVVICPAMREVRGFIDHAPDSFVALFAAGRLPAWLVEQDDAGPLRIYAVQGR